MSEGRLRCVEKHRINLLDLNRDDYGNWMECLMGMFGDQEMTNKSVKLTLTDYVRKTTRVHLGHHLGQSP